MLADAKVLFNFIKSYSVERVNRVLEVYVTLYKTLNLKAINTSRNYSCGKYINYIAP